MTKLLLALLALALAATAARVTGRWLDPHNITTLLFGGVMILVLLRTIADSEKSMR